MRADDTDYGQKLVEEDHELAGHEQFQLQKMELINDMGSISGQSSFASGKQ